jgi:hypothetical protein
MTGHGTWRGKRRSAGSGARPALSGIARRLLRARDGGMAALVAVALLPMTAAVGVAVDSSLAMITQSRLARALDAAALAAGRLPRGAAVEPEARRWFDANFPPGFMGATLTGFGVTTDARGDFVTAQASLALPTVFLGVLDIDSIDLNRRTVVERINGGAEVALIMDNTGSMRSGGKIDAMKAAARGLVQDLYGENERLDDLWVSVVPYTATVNVGAHRQDWLRLSDPALSGESPFHPGAWKGCVMARGAGDDQTDTPPSAAPFESFLYPRADDNDWPEIDERNDAQNNGRGPNLGCGPAITSLTNHRDTVLAAIDEMLPWHRGGTTGNLGLAWGWRTISPRWRGQWGGPTPETMPLARGTPLMEKVAILLTDGQNQFYDWRDHDENDGRGPGGSDFTAYGRLHDFGYGSLNDARREVDRRLQRICDAMKAEDIRIFTITFGSTPDSGTQALYRACASRPENYFHSPDNETLASAFGAIGRELTRPRIVE